MFWNKIKTGTKVYLDDDNVPGPGSITLSIDCLTRIEQGTREPVALTPTSGRPFVALKYTVRKAGGKVVARGKFGVEKKEGVA